MDLQGLPFTREFEMPVYYKDVHVGTRRVDFMVEGKNQCRIKSHPPNRSGSSGTGHKLFGSL
jgi:hypothetical protein